MQLMILQLYIFLCNNKVWNKENIHDFGEHEVYKK